MKLISIALMALMALGCGSNQVAQSPEMSSPSNFTQAERIGKIMGYLASDDLQGRDSGSEGIEMAARYIEDHFKAHGVKPYYDTYRDTLSNFQQAAAYNVVGVVEGNDPEIGRASCRERG